jgi:hypothetical protein
MTYKEIERFQRILPQLEAFHSEFDALTKKSANSPLNVFKLRIVNQAIADANGILGPATLPIRNFSQFEDVELPTNSDVSMVLAQYLEAMELLRVRNLRKDRMSRWYWIIEDSENDMELQTASPRRGMSLK